MTTNQFKKGDRVILARPDALDARNGLKAGMTGTVRRVKVDPLNEFVQAIGGQPYDLVLVQFDGYAKGHGGGLDGDGTPSHRNIASTQLDRIAA